MPDPGTVLLYILSTLAQTCAALAAFVGAVGLFRLQDVREELRSADLNLRMTAADAGWLNRELLLMTPLKEVRRVVEENCKTVTRSIIPGTPSFHPTRACDGLTRWRNARTSFVWSYWLFFGFEAWNLLVIAVSLVGFNYVKSWASSPWTFWGIWVAAIGTVGVTGYSVYAWTAETEVRLWKRLSSWWRTLP